MKKIELTKGKYAIVDDEDYPIISKYSWHVQESKWGFRVVRDIDPVGSMPMSNQVLDVHRRTLVDHKNRNAFDNRKCNLRVCNKSQNAANSKLRVDNTSGYKGVRKRKNCYVYNARINVNGKEINLGHFKSSIEAAIAYDTAAIKYFGEFALTNEKMGLL